MFKFVVVRRTYLIRTVLPATFSAFCFYCLHDPFLENFKIEQSCWCHNINNLFNFTCHFECIILFIFPSPSTAKRLYVHFQWLHDEYMIRANFSGVTLTMGALYRRKFCALWSIWRPLPSSNKYKLPLFLGDFFLLATFLAPPARF